MKLQQVMQDILPHQVEIAEQCEQCGGLLNEAAIRQFKRSGNVLKRYYRCTTGKKAGMYVCDPTKCGIRKDPKKVRIGKRVARRSAGRRVHKTAITKRTAVSKLLTKMNRRLAGK